jgi:hypothetical protein
VSAARLGVAVALIGLAVAEPARASSWSEALGTDSTQVLFLGSDGSVLRAPFHLGERHAIWTPSAKEWASRVALPSAGGRAAWIARSDLGDSARLWIWNGDTTRLVARYVSLVPVRHQVLRYEAARPTSEDPLIRGGRLLAAGASLRRSVTHPLTWTAEGSMVVFGYQEGLAVVHADSGHARQVSEAAVMSVQVLDPAPIFLAEMLVAEAPRPGAPIARARAGRAAPAWMFVYPAGERWRIFPAPGFGPTSRWASDGTTVWWTAGRLLRSVRAHDPTPVDEHRGSVPLAWVGYEPARGALAWVEGRRLMRRPAGGPAAAAVETTSPILSVLETRDGRWRALVTEDSLVLEDPAAPERILRLGLDGLRPVGLLEASGGKLLVVGERGRATLLFQIDDAAAGARSGPVLVPIEAPIRNGRFHLAPAGRHLLLARAGSSPPERLHVYEVASGRWSEVENPGVIGWEPLEAR